MQHRLHKQGNFFKFFLNALNRTGERVDAGCGGAEIIARYAVATPGEESADEFCGFPRIEGGLLEFPAQVGQIGSSKLFNLQLLTHWGLRLISEISATGCEAHTAGLP